MPSHASLSSLPGSQLVGEKIFPRDSRRVPILYSAVLFHLKPLAIYGIS